MSDPPGAATTITRGAPALLAAFAIPVLAVALVAAGWSRGTGTEDPIGPGGVAAVTLVGAALLAWRAVTQRAVLGPEDLWCRNLTVGFAVEWDRVEALRVVHRAPLVFVEVRVADLRRTHRLGAATRFAADRHGVAEMLATLRTHPRAAAVLEEEAP